jgi:hypothetical protein
LTSEFYVSVGGSFYVNSFLHEFLVMAS